MPNNSPVANAVQSSTEEHLQVLISADFTDADTTDSHTFSVDTTGTLGAVTNNNDGTFSYDPAAAFEHLAVGETATDTFTYTVDDGNGGAATETVTVTITGTNDAPVASAVSAAATENGSAVTITADFSDPDTSDSHTFSVDTTGTLGAVTNNNDGTFSYDPVAAFEHLAVGETATDTFTYTVDDGHGGTATETVTVTITGTNDAPVANAVSAAATENGSAVTISADFSDPDSSDSHTFLVDTTGTLGAVTNHNDGTFSYDPAAAFEHLAVGETATDTFTYTVDDGNGGAATETVTVTITGTNDAPVASAVSAAATENGNAVTITADFSDPDTSDSHTFSVDTTGTLGTVTNNNDGTFSYDPAAAFEHLAVGETATDSFTYTVDDGHGGTATETVTVTITGTNDAPVANAVSAAATENGSAVTISADFSDPDTSDSHTFLVDTTGKLGAVTNNNDGTFSYDPAAAFEHLAVGETATDSFTYTVEDGHGGTATETVTVTITGTNDAPVANAVSAAATENGSAVTISADFSDPDSSDSHTFLVDTTGTLGAVTNNNDGTFSYDPAAAFEHLAVGETATDSFTYTVEDGHGGTATETVTVTITGTNDAPVANAVSAAATENGSVVVITADFSDADTTDSHTFSVDTTGTLGAVTNNTDGTFSYDPVAAFEHLAVGETATDSFTYTVDDGHGGTATETVTVTITGTNDAPVANAVSAAATENSSAVTISADFSDPDTSDSHTFSVNTTGTLGSVTNNNDGTFSYDPAAAFEHLAVGETATDTFTYTVDDGHGGTATETVTVTITGTNDAPVASAVSAAATENGSAVTITADFSDPDTSDSHTFSVDTTGTLGAVTNNNDGTFSYDPAAVFEHLAVGETATDSFTYTVDDGNGGTATETVTVTITGTNDAPVADLIPVTLDEEMLSVVFAPQFSDRDLSDTHTISFDFSGSAPGTAGAVTDNGDGTYTYTVQGDYQHLGLGETSEETRFTYTVTDPSGASSTNTVVVTIQGRNDAPVAAALTASANEDGPAILLTATYSDLDVNDSHTVSVDTTGTLGTVTNHNDGTFSYDPAAAFEYLAAGETATDTFTYTVDDGNGGTATETVTVTIAGSNDGPVANAVVATATENGSAVSIAADFIDPDTTDSHTFTVDTTGTLGSVIDNGDGTFSYDPSTASFDYLAAGETATDTFAFTVTDASGASSTNTVSVTVTGENDAPVAAAVSGATDEDTLIVVSADFSDVDLTDSHIFSVDITGTLGAVINNGDGTFGYDPRGAFDHLVEGETATDTFSYTVDDGNGGTATETVTVTITGRNDVPVASPVDVSVSEDLSSVTFAPDFLDPDLPDSHTVTFDTGGATATATLSLITDNGDGTYDYAVQGSYGHLAAGETATESFTYTVTDSAGTSSTSSVTVTILGENDAPIALPVTASSDEDTAIIVSADFADEDLSDSHTFSVDTTGTIGAVVSNGDGTFSYDPSGVFDHLAEGEIATDTFTYTVDDGNGGTATETVTVTLTGINDAPIVSPLAASITEDGPSVTVAARFTDPDSDGPFLISIDTTGTIGLVTDNGDGTFSYSPNRKFEHLTAGQSVQDTFTYTVTDNHGASTTRTVTITVEGQVEPSFLWATDGEGGDRFSATAINDLGAVLVGAPADHSDGFTDSGSAYLFLPTLSGGRYSSIKLTASDATHWDGFGTSVALNDAGVAVVGGGSRLKAVYVFQSDGSGGYTETKLVSSDLAGGGTFGESVSINASGVIAVGASTGTGTEASTGSAYVYVPDGAGGYTETLLFASDGSPGDGFGKSVKVHDNGVVVVGALNGDGVEENTGAVYVYTPDGGGGYTEAKLTASEGNTSDFFGFSSDVNASGVVVVGAYGDDDFGAPNSGSAYVFTPDGAGGYTEVKLTALDRFDWDHFGYDVAINDSGAIVVGAYGNDDAGSASGAAYVYVPDGSGGYTTYKLTAPIKMRAGDLFGYSVDINEDGVVSVGAQKGDGRLTDSGVVYTFVPNADGDYFGYDEVKYTGVPADGSGANPGHDVVPLPGVLFATGGVAADQFHETAINDLGMVLVGAPGDHTGSLTKQRQCLPLPAKCRRQPSFTASAHGL